MKILRKFFILLKLYSLKLEQNKFQFILYLLIILAIIFGSLVFSYIFLNIELLSIDFQNKSAIISSLGILCSALIAAFAMLSNNEISRNKDQYQKLKYLSIQFEILEQYINFSISWLERLQSDQWKDYQQENLRLDQFINEIYNLRKEIVSKDNSFLYKRGLYDYGIAQVFTGIEEIYHYKNSYGLTRETYSDIVEALSGLSLHCMMSASKIAEKLDLYEVNSI
ncbi:MAG: hypothetical protein Q7U69_07610 [Sulfuricurvum sp.]|uniref:hypothetical protein n=1 Tax=Sulfuricurvum sp. TaxID=2025608 RepID=UPI00271B4BCE|nr:hypothetical protein [Sulfuricurvum sp.]MDO9056402.1 hypothetical protein [Sulfuricurvum sp.]